MNALYDVWFRDPLLVMEGQLGSKDFASEIDIAPKRVFSKEGKHQFSDMMTLNWPWDQAVCSLHSLQCRFQLI
jgi:hypothetical protein